MKLKHVRINSTNSTNDIQLLRHRLMVVIIVSNNRQVEHCECCETAYDVSPPVAVVAQCVAFIRDVSQVGQVLPYI